MKDGIIDINSEFGIDLGFTSDNFDGYLWEKGKDIWISFIVSKNQGQGNLSRLFEEILVRGYNIKVPTPFPRMKAIIKSHGFKHTIETDDKFGEVDVWVKKYQKKSD